MKKLILFFLMGLLVGNVFAEQRIKPKCEMAVYADARRQLESKCHLMKRWALSVCLSYAATDKETKLDAMSTAHLHGEVTSMRPEEPEVFESLIRRYLARDYRSSYFEDVKSPPELNTGKCLDLYDSAELDSLVVRVLEDREKAIKKWEKTHKIKKY